jgi:hypothetical protein
MSIYFTYKPNEPGVLHVTRQSRISGKINTRAIKATPEQMQAWLNGTVAQQAFPDASADDREFVISGITPEEWTATFGKDEEG